MNHEKRMVKFLKGDGFPIVGITPERNSKCQCGSGKKTKNCCGIKSQYFSTAPRRPEPQIPQPETQNPQPES